MQSMKRIVSLFIWISIVSAFPVEAEQLNLNPAWTVTNLGPSINTQHRERYSMISSDGLVLYFASDRPDALGEPDDRGRRPWDLYVAWRESPGVPFGEAINLGPEINSSYSEHSASISKNGHWMYFGSNRPGGCGGYDLYVSYRPDTTDHMGWQPPKHLGCALNTPFNEACPFITTDKQTGKDLLYFVRNTREGIRDYNIHLSEADRKTRVFGTAKIVAELSSPEFDAHFDPEHGFIWSGRAGGYGGADIWLTSKRSQGSGWSKPKNMGSLINTEYDEELPSGTLDGMLFFPSNRLGGYGGFDIYIATPGNH
ncbi:MAG: hypothetical protein ACI88G_001994 [Woeseiaceae bacterium]|jgi:hypothetical protein